MASESTVSSWNLAANALLNELKNPNSGRAITDGVFRFSDDPAHRSRNVVLSNNRLTATIAAEAQFGWVRCEQGVDAGCGSVKWALQLGKDGGRVYRVGVAAHAFRTYSDYGWPRLAWIFPNDAAASDGSQIGDFFDPPCFQQCDLVSMELERRLGDESVLRVEVQGRVPREIRGLPSVGVLYPIVCLINAQQTITMMPAAATASTQPRACCSPTVSPPTSPRARPTKRVVFAFSDASKKNGECAHRSPNVKLSLDRLTATAARGSSGGWARAERGISAGCGIVRWMVQLCSDREGHGRWHMLGVVSEEFDRFSTCSNKLKHAWFFQKATKCADGGKPVYCTSPCFDQGDLVTLELERFPGTESVLRIQVAGRTPQEMRGLPQDGVLYPVVCLANDRQSATMIPVRVAIPLPAAEAPVPKPAVASPLRDFAFAALLFSSDCAHKSPDVVLSPDRRSATLLPFKCCGWVRSESGFEAGCGVKKWSVKLGDDDGGAVHVMGVAADAFSNFCATIAGNIRHLWAFENGAARADGERTQFPFTCFGRLSVVTLELERFPGTDSVLRIQVAGRTPQEMRGLPQDGVLYPVVCLVNDQQKVSTVPVPR